MKPLNRPMFQRGGKVSSRNNGIVSGFDNGGRVGYEPGGAVGYLEEMGLFEEPQRQKGLSTADYLRIASAGADIMGAQPTGRSGFIGALQAASPSLGSLGRDLASSSAAKEQAYQAKLAANKKLQTGAALSDFEYGRDTAREDVVRGQDQKNKLAIIDVEHKNDMEVLREQLSVPQFETEFNLQQADELYSQMEGLDPTSEQYLKLKSKLENVLFASVQKTVLEGKIKLLGDEDFQDSIAGTVRSIVNAELQSDPDSEYYQMSEAEIKEKVTVDSFVEYGLNNVFVPAGRQNNAEGGRVGLQEGGDPMMAQQAQPNSVGLTFEELRARLPQEVTDGVVRLLATSEEALLAFANLETQEDIAQFNQKYNTDLQLPTQVA
tara:strand:- start:1516 stop:2649 length:1134 start_codon:yes stop_codon:yes gene_type:complete